MPKRVRTKTREINSVSVQGADSWVKVVSLTVEEQSILQQEMKTLQRNLSGLERRLASVNGSVEKYEALAQEVEQADKALTEYAMDVAGKYAIEWNWVDDDGEPLPQPADGGIEKLWLNEFKWLSEQIMGSVDEKKD